MNTIKILHYAYLTRRQVQIVHITCDTTESDLKQRRDIVNGNLVYTDQACVKAAIHGHMLILDGIQVGCANSFPRMLNEMCSLS